MRRENQRKNLGVLRSLGNAVGGYLMLVPDGMGVLAPWVPEAPLLQVPPFFCFSKRFPWTLSKTKT